MSDPVAQFFSNLETEDETPDHRYPGSRHTKRSVLAPKPPPPANSGWDKNGYAKILQGRRVELFPIGAMAQAINRHPNSVKHWIRQGFIPHAPFRLPSWTMPDGREVPGRRLWSRGMIESLVGVLHQYGLLDSKRVDWKRYPELPEIIRKAWDEQYLEVFKSMEGEEDASTSNEND